MDAWTRRQFLIRSGVTGAAGLVLGATATSQRELFRRAQTDALPTGTGILVIVTLYGGNDGLNTVVPYADPAYQSARPGIAYSASQVLQLDGQFGLNPGLTGLAGLWKGGHLAIVHGVGYPQPDHSHFRSMDIWQTASPTEPIGTGWIGRWLDATGDDPIRAVNVGSTLPTLAVGAKAAAAALPNGPVSKVWQPYATAFDQLGQDDPTDTDAMRAVRASFRAERLVESVFVGPTTGAPTGSDLKSQLALVGQCIKAGVPTRVYCVSMGGFDTHANEKGQQQQQLAALDAGLTPFLTDMASDPNGQHVVTMVYSEFGRRVAANASQGTDHGTAGPVFIAGAPVTGGYYSAPPSLTDLDNGDLKPTTDFRVIYAELLANVLNADPAQVLGADRPPLGFLSGFAPRMKTAPALTLHR